MEWGINVVPSGQFKGLPDYEPQLLAFPSGKRVSLVATVEVRDNTVGGGHLCKGLLTNQRFRLKAEIPNGVKKVTILGGQLTHVRGPVVTIDPLARLLHHRDKDLSTMFQLVETCSGMGALGLGASHAGWKVCAHNDKQETFVQHLQQTTSVPVVQGDIGSLATVAQLHDMAPTASCLGFGYSCQPFSKLGDNTQGSDERAQSLPYGLYAGFLLQVDIIVTECVPEAATSPFVQRCMQQYMQMTNSDRSEALLELNDVWPSRRRRWWNIILKAFMGRVTIPPFPKLNMEPTPACLFPGSMPMTDQELQELILSPQERLMFEKFGKGLGGHMLDMTKPLPTALHSWGNQCVECACGCRGPLSDHRLHSHGLYGVLVFVPNQAPDRNVRHLSGREMALLTGFAKTTGWCASQRLLTAGVGQLASPIQSSWIFAAILNHLIDNGFCEGQRIPPQQILGCVAMELFQLRDNWFGKERTVAMELFQESFEAFLAPVPTETHEVFQATTASQDEDIAESLPELEAKVPGALDPAPSQPDVLHALVSNTSVAPSHGSVHQELTTSQRGRRKHSQ